MIRRRRRHHHRAQIQRCTAEGCRNRRLCDNRFCSACWYRLAAAVRLTIEEAREAGMMPVMRRLCRDAADGLARRAIAERGGTPACAMCPQCARPAHDPVITCCTSSCCPFALQAAA